MLSDELYSRLVDHTFAGRPWPASLDRTLARVRPAQLIQLFRQLGVRNKVLEPEGMPLLEQLVTWVKFDRPSREEEFSVTLPRLLFLLRAQWDHLTSQLGRDARDRVDHVWQVQLCPVPLRKRMNRFLGVTFIPGRRLEEFPEGEEYVDLVNLNVLSLGGRKHLGREGDQVFDMLDLKVHKLHVDPDSGVVSLAPRYARHYNYSPFPGADRRIVDTDNRSVVRGGLDLHRAMEWSAATGGSVRDEPEFPRIYLGFTDPGACDLEVTTDLKISAWRHLDAYVRAGTPEEWGRNPLLPNVRNSLVGRPRPTWSDYVKVLGPRDAEFVLLSVVEAETVRHEDLFLVPLEFFGAYSEQRPVRRSVRLFARMEPHIMGRERLRGVPQLTGSRYAGVDGVVDPCPRSARLQVVRAPSRDDWAGVSGLVEWDFRTVPEWSADYFREAGEGVPSYSIGHSELD